jgi:hypothetical protein
MSRKNHVASDIEPQGNNEPSLGVILFLNILALIAIWFALFISDQFVTIFKKLFFWPPGMLETSGVALILLAVVHLIWRYCGRQLVVLVKEAKASIISDIGELLLGIVDFLHPQTLNNRALWVSFGIALVINLVLVLRLPPACPPAGAGGTIAPAIALYSVTFAVNGVKQIVDDSNSSLQMYKNARVTVKEVTICVAPFEGPGGTFYVEFQPYNTEDQLIDLVRGSSLWDAESGLKSIAGPDYAWVIGDDWQKISVLSTHFPPGGTQNPYCQERACEFDDCLEVHPAFDGLTPTPPPKLSPTVTPSQPIIAGFLVTDGYGFTSTIKARSIVTVTADQIILLRPQLSATPWPENISCLWNARVQSRGQVSPTDNCTTSYRAPGNTGPDFIIVDILEGGEQIDCSYIHIQVEAP